jgi:hypothetical protein
MGRAAVLFAVLALTGCSSGERSAGPTTTGKAAADVSFLVQRIEEIHPDPWHAISEADFKAAASDLEGEITGLTPDEQLVELMRLTALLGERDGHSGIFPLDAAHERTPHLYPLRLYEFSDGVFVVDAIDQPELVGARVVSIAGRPVEEVLDAVRPLVPADNEMSRRARLAQYIVVEEVLQGLGFSGSDFELDGETVTLDPVEADVYAAAFEDLFHPMVPQGLPRRAEPPYLARRLEDRWIARLPRAVYAAYNLTLENTTGFAAEVARTAPKPVILDLRHNPGGNNGTYPPLLEARSQDHGPDRPDDVLRGRQLHHRARAERRRALRRRTVRRGAEPVRRPRACGATGRGLDRAGRRGLLGEEHAGRPPGRDRAGRTRRFVFGGLLFRPRSCAQGCAASSASLTSRSASSFSVRRTAR